MSKMKCKACGIVFECNGDKVCPDSTLLHLYWHCYCKKCTIERHLGNTDKENMNECYLVKEKVLFT